MAQHPSRDRLSLDSQAFVLLLSAMFASTLLWASASVVGVMEAQAKPVAIAVTPSQLQCARL
jgi:hypothetical protein